MSAKQYMWIEIDPNMLITSQVSAGYPMLRAYLTALGMSGASSDPILVTAGNGAPHMMVNLAPVDTGGNLVQSFATPTDARAFLWAL